MISSRVWSVCLAALLGTSAVHGADDSATSKAGCSGFKFNLDRELALFAGKPQHIVATKSPQTATVVKADQLYAVTLSPQAEVRFAAVPGKLTVDDGSYAGVLNFTPSSDGLLQVTINEPAWLDVVVNGAAVQSVDHTGSASCGLLHKSVQFKVSKGQPLIVQISGSTIAEPGVTLTQP